MYGVFSIFDSGFHVPSILIYTGFLWKPSKWSNCSCISWQDFRFVKCNIPSSETNWSLHTWQWRVEKADAHNGGPGHVTSLPSVNPHHLEVSFKMVLWILFAAYLWNQLLYILFIFFKTILRVILITHSSLQHILFPVQTDSVFSTLKHYISKKPKHFFVLSCHEGRLDLGDTEMGFEEREGKSMKGLSLFCKFA